MFGFGKKITPVSKEFLKQHSFTEITGDRFIIDMMYAKPENILLRPIYEEVGFGNAAIAHVDVVIRLQELSGELIRQNLKMRICDAYRPPIAHRRALEILPIEALFASKAENSLHCYGTAIDVCLTDEKGRNLKFPTEVDAYDKKYAKQIAKGITEPYYKHFEMARHDFMDTKYAEQINNRALLKKIMTSVGFEIISHEWWHYQLPGGKEDYPFIEWTGWNK
jgi:D-alanyl-D-alanine dipeptidase